jgi:hypothetical protein
VTAKTLREAIVTQASRKSHLMTDEALVYERLGREFAGHGTVNHSADEYVRTGGFPHTNTVESFFALLKRAVYGQFHHVSEAHLHRYLGEADFKYKHPLRDRDRSRRRSATRHQRQAVDLPTGSSNHARLNRRRALCYAGALTASASNFPLRAPNLFCGLGARLGRHLQQPVQERVETRAIAAIASLATHGREDSTCQVVRRNHMIVLPNPDSVVRQGRETFRVALTPYKILFVDPQT